MTIDLDVLEGLARQAYHDYGLADIAVGGGAKATVSVPAFISAASPSVVLTLVAAARERDGLREAAKGIDRMMLVIESAVRRCETTANHELVLAALKANRQSLAPNAGEPK